MKSQNKGAITKFQAMKDVKFINLKALVQVAMKERNTSFRQLSARMNQSPSYMAKEMVKKDHSIGLLLTLSRQLNVNLIEPYLVLLPTDIRGVKNEKILMEQISSLEKKLMDVKKERDWLKEVVMKK